MSKPSEKAMRLAELLIPAHAHIMIPTYQQRLEHAALAIDAFAAEALSEHKRVLDEAVEALTEISKRIPSFGHEGVGTVARNALAAIAELKTNEKP